MASTYLVFLLISTRRPEVTWQLGLTHIYSRLYVNYDKLYKTPINREDAVSNMS